VRPWQRTPAKHVDTAGVSVALAAATGTDADLAATVTAAAAAAAGAAATGTYTPARRSHQACPHRPPPPPPPQPRTVSPPLGVRPQPGTWPPRPSTTATTAAASAVGGNPCRSRHRRCCRRLRPPRPPRQAQPPTASPALSVRPQPGTWPPRPSTTATTAAAPAVGDNPCRSNHRRSCRRLRSRLGPPRPPLPAMRPPAPPAAVIAAARRSHRRRLYGRGRLPGRRRPQAYARGATGTRKRARQARLTSSCLLSGWRQRTVRGMERLGVGACAARTSLPRRQAQQLPRWPPCSPGRLCWRPAARTRHSLACGTTSLPPPTPHAGRHHCPQLIHVQTFQESDRTVRPREDTRQLRQRHYQGLSWIYPQGLYPCIISISAWDTSRGRISKMHDEKRRRGYIYPVRQKLREYFGSVSQI